MTFPLTGLLDGAGSAPVDDRDPFEHLPKSLTFTIPFRFEPSPLFWGWVYGFGDCRFDVTEERIEQSWFWFSEYVE